MDLNEGYTVEKPGEGMMDLTIEKVLDDELSVAHYFTQRGDLMRDPEIVFSASDWSNWTAIEYRQDGFPQVYQHDENGLDADTQSFASQWSDNLRSQGYVEAALNGNIE